MYITEARKSWDRYLFSFFFFSSMATLVMEFTKLTCHVIVQANNLTLVPFLQFKNKKNTHGGVLLLVKLQVSASLHFVNEQRVPEKQLEGPIVLHTRFYIAYPINPGNNWEHLPRHDNNIPSKAI